MMKRTLYFFSGLVLLIFMAYTIIKALEIPELYGYVLTLEKYNAFEYVYYSIIGLLFLMSLIFLILTFRPSHNKRTLLWKTHSGELELSKKSIESYIEKSITPFDHIRLHNMHTTLKSKGTKKSIRSNVNILWLPDHDKSEASLADINKHVKSKLEQFTNADVDGINIKVIDQKKTDKRVV